MVQYDEKIINAENQKIKEAYTELGELYYQAHKKDYESGFHYYGARYYWSELLSGWLSVDPMMDKYPGMSPYNFCMMNPINVIDPDGMDTINITYSTDNDKWEISKPIVAEGNDVFNVTGADGTTNSYTFSEGTYGERVDCLNIDGNDNYMLGVYHVSGTEEGGTGFYVTPGGESSTVVGSGKRIPEGTYPIITPNGTEEWRQPGVGGSVYKRGIRFHYGNGNPRKWTAGCFVLFTEYTKNGSGIRITKSNSVAASEAFDKHLGASGFYDYTFKGSDGKLRTRQGATFPQKINKTLVLKQHN